MCDQAARHPPQVRYDDRVFRDEHPVVVVVLGDTMRDANSGIDTHKSIKLGSRGRKKRQRRTHRADGVALEDFQKDRFHVRQIGSVVHGREAPWPDHRIEFFLSTFLHLGVAEHGEYERAQCCRCLGWGWRQGWVSGVSC